MPFDPDAVERLTPDERVQVQHWIALRFLQLRVPHVPERRQVRRWLRLPIGTARQLHPERVPKPWTRGTAPPSPPQPAGGAISRHPEPRHPAPGASLRAAAGAPPLSGRWHYPKRRDR